MGLQTLDRAVTVLRALGGGGEEGLRLIDLQHIARLTKPTTHRLLAALLAEETGDTVFVVVRSGFDTVCIERHTGAYPIKALTVDVGTRRPLGVGAGGLAMLAALPPTESDAILAAVAERLGAYTRATPAQLRAAIRDARKSGHAVSTGFVTEGVRGVSVALRDFRGEPIAAIGIAAILPRIPAKRVAELARALDRERRRIESRLLATQAGSNETHPAPARRHRLR